MKGVPYGKRSDFYVETCYSCVSRFLQAQDQEEGRDPHASPEAFDTLKSFRQVRCVCTVVPCHVDDDSRQSDSVSWTCEKL